MRKWRRVAWAALLAVALTAAACTNDDPPGKQTSAAGETDQDATGSPEANETPGNEDQGRPAWLEAACGMDPTIIRRVNRGTEVGRSPDVSFLPRRPHFIGSPTYTSHSGPDEYLQEVPLVFYGPGFVKSAGRVELDREVTVADIAPTVAELVGTPFPEKRPGQVLEEALLPRSQRPGKPALVMVVIWDGGGINVLEQWPDAWPHLAGLMEQGTSFENATVGSSPSVTPAVHASIGTGAFPNTHGVVDMWIRTPDEIIEPDPGAMVRPTLADLYDRAEGNVPVIGVVSENDDHWGMMGQGAEFSGGDSDIAIRVSGEGEVGTIADSFSLPSSAIGVPGLDEAIQEIDSSDGSLDSRWLDTPLDELAKGTPAWILYQTMISREVLTQEGFGQDEVPDLFFTNYKEIDLAGHEYNMVNPEVESSLEYTDGEIPKLQAILDEVAGPRNWVMAITADHGQQPEAEAIDAWPIQIGPLAEDLAAHFDVGRYDLIQQSRPTGFWLDHDLLEETGITLDEVADFFVDYTIEDNASEGLGDFESRADERLFDTAMPAERIKQALACAKKEA